MPLVEGQYTRRTADDILAFLEAELKEEFGVDIDLTEGSAWSTLAAALATSEADNVEAALQEVFSASAVDDAKDEELDRLVAIVGVARRESVHATGVVEFSHNGTADQDYTISNGTIVKTSGDSPIEFETTELVQISLFDDFEDGTLSGSYAEDTASFEVVDGSLSGDPSPAEGSFLLKSTATAGVKIIQTGVECSVGSTIDFRTYLQNSVAGAAIAHNLFGVVDADNHYRVVIDDSGSHAIEIVAQGTPSTLVSSTPTVPSDEWLHNEIVWSPENQGTITSRLYNAAGTLIDEIEIQGEGRIEQGGFGFGSGDANENKYWDHSGLSARQANVRAREGGVEGNVGANTLTVLPVVPSGVDSVTNPFPTGSTDHYLTDLTTYVTGLPRETDVELRERVKRSDGTLGKATVPALIANMLALEGAESVTVFENKTNTDNTGSGGLPPKSFELVFFGTTPNQDVAEALFDVKAFTARDYGGANGTEVTEDVTASNGQVFTLRWSEPNVLSVDMTLDLVVNENYVGDDEIRRRIVEYIGGTGVDGTSVLGTGVGEDVYIHQLQDAIVGPEDTGVIGIDEGESSFTPATTTDVNGLEIIDVGSNEVAQTNGEDGSITITTTVV